MRCIIVLSLATGAEAHGVITLPTNRMGGSLAKGGCCSPYNPASWYTMGTSIPGKATNTGLHMRTMTFASGAKSPWKGPGSAPITSPCGKLATMGQDGLTLPKNKQDSTTRWVAGSTAKVAFGISVNHGGGYAYRICPSSPTPTEACFQQHHLTFADDKSIIHWTDGREQTIAATRGFVGAGPPGSHWTRFPIPAGPMTSPFLPPCAGCTGGANQFSIVDNVKVPSGIAPGEYLLSFRYDAEGQNSVWLGCADITIAGSSDQESAAVISASQLKVPDYLAAGTLTLAWKDCGDADTHCKITGFTPATATIGQPVVLDTTTTCDEDIPDGNFEATLKGMGIQLMDCKGDASADKTCKFPMGSGTMTIHAVPFPIKANTETHSKTDLLVNTMSGMKSSVTTTKGVTKSGDKYYCLEVTTSVSETSTNSTEVETALLATLPLGHIHV